ncbi:alpha/beta-hydrolase [Penicillium alfredii]|uniref:Alpha/beta-hydrolase n=1 Tax=Penicillium alfredii TaxID=1506179 RepID=A0A9W9FKW3_9EURO|nr:alpha/beta-hydrolase [Penicillium alfredii]KAJ5102111.1 alpha/beta-hydrolase [Penicillium alfredii]
MFLRLPYPKMFMFGDENSGLSYLGRLAGDGVELAEIVASGHFPMDSNPIEMFRRNARFLDTISLGEGGSK